MAMASSPGRCWSICKPYCMRRNISYQLEGFPPRRLYRNLANGTSDFWIGVKQAPDYEGKVLYGDQPIITLHLQLYWLPEVAPLQTLEQLREQN